ncbi:MAG: hypothetical protein JSV55_09930 [Deltaproteobacteria bacterium]|nr:MAG: hypothetical protein JSV40_05280 [Deltaproteobacteria bacterium]UCH06430.1 MAG: hypothetical protein JSV55_09930 [Deltaproteobacteria bacterium]
MEERIELLVCLGAATAANCVPCFEYYHAKAAEVGLASQEILKAVELATQVKKGAHMAMKNSVNGIMGQERRYDLPCTAKAGTTCCT